ncbi:response regulator [candidate division KSB1 bacterium]
MVKQKDKIRLLLVDDEEDFLISVKNALNRRDIDVLTARNGEEAIRNLYEKQFDIAVLDVKMPGIDGIEVFHRFKRKKPGLPVIILTGHGTIDQAFETSKEGVTDYLKKPCDIDTLVEKVHKILRVHTVIESEESIEKSPHTKDIRVLVVDDELDLLNSLKNVLQRRRMVVYTAEGGKEAISTLENIVVDIVILDIKMPGMDGIEVLRYIKQKFPAIEVILLTGHPETENAIKGIKLGAYEYIIKPPNIDNLTESILSAYRHRQEKLEKRHRKSIRNILDRYPE